MGMSQAWSTLINNKSNNHRGQPGVGTHLSEGLAYGKLEWADELKKNNKGFYSKQKHPIMLEHQRREKGGTFQTR